MRDRVKWFLLLLALAPLLLILWAISEVACFIRGD